MSGSLIDDLGRALAQPISRRRTMRLFLAGGAALALPPLRPRLPVAHAGASKLCYAATEDCTELVCGQYAECCQWTNCPDCISCKVSRTCCDPCGVDNVCGGEGCTSGGGTCEQCCKQRGQGECSDASTNECCQAGEIFTGGTGGRCCRRSDFRAPCGIARGDCRDKTRESADKEIDVCQANFLADAFEGSLIGESARFHKCLRRAHRFFTKQMERCPKEPDSSVCGEGTCNRNDLKCDRECEGSPPIPRRAAARARGDDLAPSAAANRAASSDGSPISRGKLRGRIQAAQPRLNRAFRGVKRELGEIPFRGALIPEADLADAYAAYRKEVVRLRGSLTRGKGGQPQRLALATLDASLSALAAYRRAALAGSFAREQRENARGDRAMARAARLAPRARRALGCGKTC